MERWVLRGRGGALRALLLVGTLGPLLAFLAFAVVTWSHAQSEAASEARRQAGLLAEYVTRILDGHSLLIDLIEEHLARRPPGALNSELLTHILADHKPLADLTISLVATDADGKVVANTLSPSLQGKDMRDREYFSRAITGDGIVIGEQVTGRVTRSPFFSLSRRLAGGGVIVVAIYGDTFEKLFGEAAKADGKHRVVSLFRQDGVQLARFPRLSNPVTLRPGSPGLMSHMPAEVEGIYRVSPTSGGGPTIFGFHQVGAYPVWVTYGIRQSAIDSAWLRALIGPALSAMSVAALAAILALRALHQERDSFDLEERLRKLVAERTAEVERRAAEAERADAAKTVFLASASHDLRQPVQGLRLALDILEPQLDRPEQRRALDLASKALNGVEDLLRALLDVSVLDSGMVIPQIQDFCLGPLLRGLVEEFEPQAAARGLELRHVPCSAWVTSDPVLLARMLRNLLSNALRHTPRGRVLLGCRQSGRSIRIEVLDTGPGIPGSHLAAVFDDFVQLDNPERDRLKGLGLGLGVVRRMSALLGHPVGVRSVEGRGSSFFIRLGRCSPAQDEGARAPDGADALHDGAAVDDSVLVSHDA